MVTKAKKTKAPEVGVMFRAPQELRGAVRKITAWAEMTNFRINGKVPLEKDVWAWMAAALYGAGEDQWPEMLKTGAESFARLASVDKN